MIKTFSIDKGQQSTDVQLQEINEAKKNQLCLMRTHQNFLLRYIRRLKAL